MKLILPVIFFSIFYYSALAVDIDGTKSLSYDDMQNLSITSVSNPDSAIIRLKLISNTATSDLDTTKLLEAILTLSDIYHVNEKYSSAFDYGGQALFLAEQFKDTFLLSEAYNKYGILNYLFYQKDDAIKYLNKSVELSKNLKKTNGNTPQLRSRYFNLALAHRKFENYNMALTYLDSCYALGNKETPYIDSEKGIILLKQKKYNEAIPVLIASAKQFEKIEDLKDPKNTKGYLLVIYAHLAEAYEGIKDYTKALQYYSKAYLSLENNKRYMSHKASILERYGWLEYKVGRYRQACERLREASEINEKHFSTRTISNADFLTTRDKYQESIQQKDKEIAIQNLLIAEHEKKMLRINVILYSLVLFILLFIIFIYTKHKIKKQKRAFIEIEEKEKEAKLQLEQKNKELTASTLKLIEKDELVDQLSMHLKNIASNNEIDGLLKSISQQSKTLWDDFNSRFMAVNEGFYENINNRFPELSPADLKICALIKLNFSGKEMAHLLGISINSVNKARYRLRKKMNLDRKVNLSTYISSF